MLNSSFLQFIHNLHSLTLYTYVNTFNSKDSYNLGHILFWGRDNYLISRNVFVPLHRVKQVMDVLALASIPMGWARCWVMVGTLSNQRPRKEMQTLTTGFSTMISKLPRYGKSFAVASLCLRCGFALPSLWLRYNSRGWAEEQWENSNGRWKLRRWLKW